MCLPDSCFPSHFTQLGKSFCKPHCLFIGASPFPLRQVRDKVLLGVRSENGRERPPQGFGTRRPEFGLLGGSDGKEPTCNAGDLGSIPGLGRSPGEGSGHPLQYSHLENSMDRGAWWATDHGVAKSLTRLSD